MGLGRITQVLAKGSQKLPATVGECIERGTIQFRRRPDIFKAADKWYLSEFPYVRELLQNPRGSAFRKLPDGNYCDYSHKLEEIGAFQESIKIPEVKRYSSLVRQLRLKQNILSEKEIEAMNDECNNIMDKLYHEFDNPNFYTRNGLMNPRVTYRRCNNGIVQNEKAVDVYEYVERKLRPDDKLFREYIKGIDDKITNGASKDAFESFKVFEGAGMIDMSSPKTVEEFVYNALKERRRWRILPFGGRGFSKKDFLTSQNPNLIDPTTKKSLLEVLNSNGEQACDVNLFTRFGLRTKEADKAYRSVKSKNMRADISAESIDREFQRTPKSAESSYLTFLEEAPERLFPEVKPRVPSSQRRFNRRFINEMFNRENIAPYPNSQVVSQIKQLSGSTTDILQKSKEIFARELGFPKDLVTIVEDKNILDCTMGFEPVTGRILIPSTLATTNNQAVALLRHELDHFVCFASLAKTIGIEKFKKLVLQRNPDMPANAFNDKFWEDAIKYVEKMGKREKIKYSTSLKNYTSLFGDPIQFIRYYANPLETRAYDVEASLLKSLGSHISGAGDSIISSRIARRITDLLSKMKKADKNLDEERLINELFEEEKRLVETKQKVSDAQLMNNLLNRLENLYA